MSIGRANNVLDSVMLMRLQAVGWSYGRKTRTSLPIYVISKVTYLTTPANHCKFNTDVTNSIKDHYFISTIGR